MFKQPIRVDNITQEQCDEIVPFLRQLGYITRTTTIVDTTNESLVTWHGGVGCKKDCGLSTTPSSLRDRLRLPYNKELILAIAAMRESDDFHVGEYLIWGSDNHTLYKIIKVHDKTHVDIEWNNGGKINTIKRQVVNEDFARKATVEEILAYFNCNGATQFNKSSTTEEVINNVGYNGWKVGDMLPDLYGFSLCCPFLDKYKDWHVNDDKKTFNRRTIKNIVTIKGKVAAEISNTHTWYVDLDSLPAGSHKPKNYDKWYVEVIPNSEFAREVCAYINSKTNLGWRSGASFSFYCFNEELNTTRAYASELSVPEEYTKLTEEEWRKYVLRKEVIINHKINKNDNQKKHGETIKVPRTTPSITTGQRFTGHPIRGRSSKATIRVGHLSNQTIIG